MISACRISPAQSWRAFLLLGLTFGLLSAIPVRGQRGMTPIPDLMNSGNPDPEEGRQVLQTFRSQGLSGDYFLEFELRVLPRRGPERDLMGRLWGTRGPEGDISRVSLDTSEGEVRLLVRNGPDPEVWQWRSDSGITEIGADQLRTPLAGTELTAFDLLRPFLFWPDEYEGLERVSGRPAHQYRMEAPEELRSAQGDGLAAVRLSIDSQYQAMVQAEYLNERDQVIKTMTVRELKKLGEQWIVRSLDLRNETTRDKTRFQVTAAALNLTLPDELFTTEALLQSWESPTQLTPID